MPDEEDESEGKPSAAPLGLVLGAVAWLQVIAAAAHGLTLPNAGSQAYRGDTLQRLGAGFLNDVGTATALLPLLGALMAYHAAAVGAAKHGLRPALIVCSTAACAVFVGSVLALAARLHQFGVAHVGMPAYQRWALAAYLAGNVGAAVTTVGVSSWVFRRWGASQAAAGRAPRSP